MQKMHAIGYMQQFLVDFFFVSMAVTLSTHFVMMDVGTPFFPLFFALIFCATAISVGLYDTRNRVSMKQWLIKLTASCMIPAVMISLFLAITSPSKSSLWLPMLMAVPLSMVFVWLWRFLFKQCFKAKKPRLLVLGSGQRASFLSKRMRREKDRLDFYWLGFIPMSECNDPLVMSSEDIHSKRSNNVIDEAISSLAPDIIVVACEHEDEVDHALLIRLKLSGVRVCSMEQFAEHVLGQIPLSAHQKNALLFSRGFRPMSLLERWVSYGFNAFIATLMLLMVWPVMLFTSLLIYWEDGRKTGAGCFYRQVRVGKNGQPFVILKFRSMGLDAEKDGASWAVKGDPRVTKVGRIIRKYRIDELPQLLNVLRGDMTFVGPRPERPEFTDLLAKKYPDFPLRNMVTPGLTGWAQLNYPYGASDHDSFEKLKFDMYYIKHRNFWFDVFILFRTVEIVLFGKGR